MTKSKERQIDSEITGMPSLGSVVENVIGQRHGEIGSGDLIPAATAKWAAALLDKSDPMATDRAIRASMRSVLAIATRSACSVIIPADEPSYEITTSVEFVELDGFTTGNYNRAYGALMGSTDAIGIEGMLGAIGMLRAVTASRQAHEMDIKAMAAIYAHSLREFPRDCVVSAALDWPKRKGRKFMPTVSELYPIIQQKASWRLCALKAAKDAAKAELEKTQ